MDWREYPVHVGADSEIALRKGSTGIVIFLRVSQCHELPTDQDVSAAEGRLRRWLIDKLDQENPLDIIVREADMLFKQRHPT